MGFEKCVSPTIGRKVSSASRGASANGLQAWEVADANELSYIGKIDFFREDRVEATENKAISYACCYRNATDNLTAISLIL